MGDESQRQRLRPRASHIILLLVAVTITILLAWWQWTRFKSGSGTFQNLGYALQWPLFGGFFVFAYKKFLEYENEKIDADNTAEDLNYLYELDVERFGDGTPKPTAIADDFLPARPHISVEQFNSLNSPHRGDNITGIDQERDQ